MNVARARRLALALTLAAGAALGAAACRGRLGPQAPPAVLHLAPDLPYDLAQADALLTGELGALRGHVAVIVAQDGRELYRFQAGDIDFDTRTRLASLTKTISAAVVLTCVDAGELTLDERLGALLPELERAGLGAATVRDAFGMRHGLAAPLPYEHMRRLDLEASIARLARRGRQAFAPGTRLDYDGKGMQAVGLACQRLAGAPWEQLARERVLAPCGALDADWREFGDNPAIPGGLRASAADVQRFGAMVLAGGVHAGRRVLSEAAVAELFTDATHGLPVEFTPWPASDPRYPYGAAPDYGFGAWVLARAPESGHVEEIVGAGAWGSFLWIDRRRGLVATLVTDVRAGSQAALPAALGLFALARREIDAHQVRGLTLEPAGERVRLAWELPAGARAARVYASDAPLRDRFDLRRATLVAELVEPTCSAPPARHFAVTALFGASENVALTPGANAR